MFVHPPSSIWGWRVRPSELKASLDTTGASPGTEPALPCVCGRWLTNHRASTQLHRNTCNIPVSELPHRGKVRCLPAVNSYKDGFHKHWHT